MEAPNETSNTRSSCRAGQSNKILFVYGTDLGIKPGQTQRCAGNIDKGYGPADFVQSVQGPEKSNESGRNTEGNHIREAVIFLAKLALSVGHSRNATVQPVQYHGNKDCNGSIIKNATCR